MALPDELQGKNRDDIEAWFLSAVEADPMPVDALLDVLASQGDRDGGDPVESWAELLQDALTAQGDTDATLRLLDLRCRWSGDSPAFRKECRQVAKAVFTSHLGKAYVKNVGFEGSLPPSECLRRLRLLATLEKGTRCHEKTWGFGVVKRLDDFYERVTIDFVGKPRHEMSMAYAAETLDLISDDHLLARRHRDPEALTAMAKEDPAEVVRIALRSYGPLDVAALKERLVDDVLPEADWKPFWDAARKTLKKDALVHVPTRRSEPIELLESPEALVAERFDELAALRAPERILEKAEQLEADGLFNGLGSDHAAVLNDRLGFAIWGAEGNHPDLVARALLMAIRTGAVRDDGSLGERNLDVDAALEGVLTPQALKTALSALPVRVMSGLLEYAARRRPERLAANLIPLLPDLSYSVIAEAIPRLCDMGDDAAVGEAVGKRVAARDVTPSLLLWIFKHPDTAQHWIHEDPAEVLRQGLDVIEWPEAGDQLRAQHQLRALFESGSWLTDRMHALSHEQRMVLLNRVQSCRGWEESGRRSVIAGIIKAYPELQEAVKATAADDAQPVARLTSWRTYRERQAQFKKLVEVDIPANSREIAVARSYGDLRENAEYKYAKEHQRILYRRRDEMEADLQAVKGTDFANVPTDCAGMGTLVAIRRPDGREETFCILGEWDRDEGLNIISSLSQLAQCLEGHCPGDRVTLPGRDGKEACEVLRVEGLSDEIKAWLTSD